MWSHRIIGFFMTLVGVLWCTMVYAQEQNFDLSLQRSEKQVCLPVPGRVLDHDGIIINPQPQYISVDRNKTLDLSDGVSIRDVEGCFAKDFSFLEQKRSAKVKVTVRFRPKLVAKQGVKEVSGAYVLRVDKNGIEITGYDEIGAFYGIQTLRELVQSPVSAGGRLPFVEVRDWPDLPFRGVVEGFYGNPWTHAVRLALVDFYGRYKMNTYLYGPKDDPYHSSPDWRKPYPEKQAQNIRELVDACRRNRVEFVWAIHPGQDIKWNEEDYNHLLRKFNWMYELGVRSFAVFFDDISGEGTDPVRQVELMNRLNREFVKAKGDVLSLTVCPTDYSRLWANPGPQGSLAVYGRTLDPDIKVFWTGDVVCSDLTPRTMQWINSRINRPAYYWWNYPVTDYARNIVMQGPVYGLDTTLTRSDLCGIVSNPMEHGSASKLALYGVADYAWNVSDYNPLDNWERGITVLVPDVHDAYRTFAIHSCDTETGYRRDESWETATFRMADWSDEAAARLREEFVKIEMVPMQMDSGCADRELYNELKPWLLEFGKLGARGRAAIDLARSYLGGMSDSLFWESYIRTLMTTEDRRMYMEHKSGTMKLQPFYENIMSDMAEAFALKVFPDRPMFLRGISSFANGRTVLTDLMFDNDSTTYYTSGEAQHTDDWIGVDLGAVFAVNRISVYQGRNSVDDVDYFDHAVLECSADGRTWEVLLDSLVRQYVIQWNGTAVKARYVRIRKLPSDKTNYAAVRSFEINPLTESSLGFDIKAADVQSVLPAFDGRLDTFCEVGEEFVYGVEPDIDAYVVFCGHSENDLKFELLDAAGAVLAETIVRTAYARVSLCEGVVSVRVSGKGCIYELIPMP